MPSGGQTLGQVIFYVQDVNGNHAQEFVLSGPPYTASWNTTKDPNGPFYVTLGVTDTLGRRTYVDITVTVDNSAGGTSGGTTGGTSTGTGTGAGGLSNTTGRSSTSGTTTGLPQSTIGGTPTGGSSRGCSSTGGLSGMLAALIGVAWLMRPKQRRPR